ncbi:MAG: DPP IV N-terminal domain-containing protein, partial [Bacteroidota bacterium]
MNNTKQTSMTIFLFSLLFCWTSQGGLAQDESPLIRYPVLSPDANQIAFSYQGDIWTMTINGQDARRLTIHEAYEGWPQWSPDGQSLAFSSNRFGNNDIYTIPARGGKSTRLTFHSAGDAVESWLPDGQILFSTRRVFRQVEREGEIHRIAASGGTPERYLNSFGAMPKMSPNQRFLVFVKGSCRIAREAYKGPANRNLWIYDTKNQTYTQLTDFEGQDIYPQWGDDQTIYYLSAANGRYNIHRLKINAQGKAEGSPEALTNYTDFGLRSLDISKNGEMAVFSRGGDVYKMPSSGGNAQKIQIQFQSDDRYDPISHETFSNNIQDYALSPNGKLAALVIRGEIFVKKNDKENSQTVNLSKHAYRDQEVTWLNDSTLIFVSDRDGQRDLYLARSRDSEESSLFKSLKSE